MSEIGAIYIDPRDSYISWLKSEFAASNAIIDAFILHLRATNHENAEYDDVYKCVQLRRMNWGSVIHMQQYCSIGDVLTALRDAFLRKQHDRRWDQGVHKKPGGFGKFKNVGRSVFNRSCSSANSSFSDMSGPIMDCISESSCNQKTEKNSLNYDVQNGEISHETQFAKLDKSRVTEADFSMKHEENLFIDGRTKLDGSHTLQTKVNAGSNTASTPASNCSMVGGEILCKGNLQNGRTLHEAEITNLDTCVTITDCNRKGVEKLFGSDCTELDRNNAVQTKGSNIDSISESSCNLKDRENPHNCNLEYRKNSLEADLSKQDSFDATEIDCNMEAPNTAFISESCCNIKGRENLRKCTLKTEKISHEADLAKLDTVDGTEIDCNMDDKNNLFRADCTESNGSHILHSEGSNITSVPESCHRLKASENSHNCNQTNGEISHHAGLANQDTVCLTVIDRNMKDRENLLGPDCTENDKIHASQNKGNSKNILHTILPQTQSEDEELVVIPRVFVANEMCDGKQVNVVDGLKQYAELFGTSDVKKFISLSRDFRASGRKGLLKGRTFLSLERPMKGHGREMIQLGSIVAGHLEPQNLSGSQRECRAELIPTLMEDIFDRLLQLKILTVKPDFCIIDFFSEGEYTHPYVWPIWYGRPVCNLFLTECDMAFSTNSDTHGLHQGDLKFTFAPGDVVVMEGKSADMVKRSIPPSPTQRALLTFGKSQPRKQVSAPESHAPKSRPHRHSGQLNYKARPYPPQPPMLASPAMPYPAVPCPPAQPWSLLSGTGVFFPSSEKDSADKV